MRNLSQKIIKSHKNLWIFVAFCVDLWGFLWGIVWEKCESFVKVIVNLWGDGGILWEMCGFHIFIGR